MKVLFICSGNKSNGKPSILVKNQADSLIEQGCQISFFLVAQKGVIGYLKAVFPIYRAVKKQNPTIVHAHYSLSAFAASLAILLIIKNRPKIVVSLMGSDAQMKGWKRSLTNFFSSKLWYATIVKSEQMAKNLGLKQFIILPNGVQLDKFRNEESPDENKVLFAADPTRESKNIELAKKAIELAKKEIPSLKLKVIFNVEHTEIIHEIKTSACILSTSKWEGSPNVIKESLACNRPIVATDVGDIAWLLADVEGCYVTDFNPEVIAGSIVKALNFNREKKYTNGLEKINQLQLDSRSIAKRIMKIYE